MSGSSAAPAATLAALGEALAAAIEPLAAHLSPRTLARLARTSQSLRQSISGNDAFWAATARHMGLALGSRASLVQHFRSRCVFCCDVVANASVQASVIRLDLGAATPAARRASPRVLGPARRVHCTKRHHETRARPRPAGASPRRTAS